MNIVAFLDDKVLIGRLRALCKDKGYHLKVFNNLDNPSDIFMNTSLRMGSSPWFAPDFQAIITDEKFISILHELNKTQFKHRFFLYPFLLVINDINKHSAALAIEAEVSAVIHHDASNEEFLLRLQVLSNSFQYIRQMREWAFRDMLTNLNNRRTFNDYLSIYYNTYIHYHIPFCLAVIDLDHFKKINDTYGHQKGDEVLINLSHIMRSNTRKTDILARIGGEEFAIIFPDTTMGAAFKVLQRISKKVASYKDQDGVGTTLSAGLVEAKPLHTSRDKILSEADGLLYQAKNEGRNQIRTGEISL